MNFEKTIMILLKNKNLPVLGIACEDNATSDSLAKMLDDFSFGINFCLMSKKDRAVWTDSDWQVVSLMFPNSKASFIYNAETLSNLEHSVARCLVINAENPVVSIKDLLERTSFEEQNLSPGSDKVQELPNPLYETNIFSGNTKFLAQCWRLNLNGDYFIDDENVLLHYTSSKRNQIKDIIDSL